MIILCRYVGGLLLNVYILFVQSSLAEQFCIGDIHYGDDELMNRWLSLGYMSLL